MSSKPLIAIPAYHLPAGRITRWDAGGFAAPEAFVESVERAGGRPVLLTDRDHDDASGTLAAFDGLMLIGGGDIDPFLYGTEPHDNIYGVDRDRDLFEMALVREAVETAKPTLAICRGIQIANTAFGGSLHQHLPDLAISGHGVPSGRDGAYVRGQRDVQAGSLLAEALGATHLEVSCSHHQAVDGIGGGLKAVAWSDDGLVEGLERGDGWFVAVQWHPEVDAPHDLSQQALFATLVSRATG